MSDMPDTEASFRIEDFFSFDAALDGIEPLQSDATPYSQRNDAPTGCAGGRTCAPDPVHPVSKWSDDPTQHRFSATTKRPHDDASEAMDEERKMRRMARNRRAAATSRSRKKEQLDVMQSEINRLLDANNTLQHENTRLRRLFASHVSDAMQHWRVNQH